MFCHMRCRLYPAPLTLAHISDADGSGRLSAQVRKRLVPVNCALDN